MRSSLFLSVLASATVVASVGSSALASGALKADFSAMTNATSPSQKEMQKTIEAAIAKNCRAMSRSDKVQVISEKVLSVNPLAGSGHVVGESKPACNDPDLPCSTVIQYVTGEEQMIESNLVLERTGAGYGYQIDVQTHWDYDLPMPMANVQIKGSSYCKESWTGPQQ